MDEEALAGRFHDHRSRLSGLAYRMLGSQSEADDAVQEVWMRLSRADADEIENLGGWLTTVTSRVCLNMLRSRRVRREDPIDAHVPDPVIARDDGGQTPEEQAVLAESVGLALLVVLDTLTPPERLAFVLHDLFAVPFDEIAPILGRTPEATRQLASRGRRKVQGAGPPDADVSRQRAVVDAFFAAARSGDFERLVAVLDPDVVVRSDGGALRAEATLVSRGAEAVARRAITFANPEAELVPVLVNGAAGVVVVVDSEPFSIMGFTIADGRVLEVDVLVDPERVARVDLSAIGR